MESVEVHARIQKEQARPALRSVDSRSPQSGAKLSTSPRTAQKACTMHSRVEQSRAFALVIRTSAWTPVAISYLGTNTHRRSDTKGV